jgi:nitrate reductase NapE component
VKTPSITVTCECGDARLLPYRTLWTCERCGRRWNTGQIPESEYRELEKAVRRYQIETLAFAVAVVAIFAPLTILVDVRIGLVGLFVFFVWTFFLRPRRQRRLVASVLPGARWQLHPE